MKYLISTVETYRADNETEAKELIENAKQDNNFVLAKYSSEYKERKQKGEVVDAYYKVTLTKVFDDIKEPCNSVSVSYGNDSAF